MSYFSANYKFQLPEKDDIFQLGKFVVDNWNITDKELNNLENMINKNYKNTLKSPGYLIDNETIVQGVLPDLNSANKNTIYSIEGEFQKIANIPPVQATDALVMTLNGLMDGQLGYVQYRNTTTQFCSTIDGLFCRACFFNAEGVEQWSEWINLSEFNSEALNELTNKVDTTVTEVKGTVEQVRQNTTDIAKVSTVSSKINLMPFAKIMRGQRVTGYDADTKQITFTPDENYDTYEYSVCDYGTLKYNRGSASTNVFIGYNSAADKVFSKDVATLSAGNFEQGNVSSDGTVTINMQTLSSVDKIILSTNNAESIVFNNTLDSRAFNLPKNKFSLVPFLNMQEGKLPIGYNATTYEPDQQEMMIILLTHTK